MKTTLCTIVWLLCLLPTLLVGQDLIYKPKNPAFGGDTFNYQWLLSSAQAQDLIDDPRPNDRFQTNTLDSFTESLNRSLLAQLSRQLVTSQFGENGLEDGTYVVGNFQIDVTSTIEGVVISILDSVAGEQTEIVIPFF